MKIEAAGAAKKSHCCYHDPMNVNYVYGVRRCDQDRVRVYALMAQAPKSDQDGHYRNWNEHEFAEFGP